MQVIAHNLLSQFTNRQLNISSKEEGKSAEKLSSGYRINRSADDAAGLQISEKMRSQIRGLNQASRNIQDGISLCQVADGALNETHSILQRMRELSVQAANDTNQEIDREAIQAEIDELTKEVDRIAKDTNFNNGIYPLLGNMKITSQQISSENVSGAGNISQIKNDDMLKIFNDITVTFYANKSVYIDNVLYQPNQTITMNAVYFIKEDSRDAYPNAIRVFSDCCGGDGGDAKIASVQENVNKTYIYLFTHGLVYDDEHYESLRKSDLKADDNGVFYISNTLTANPKVYILKKDDFINLNFNNSNNNGGNDITTNNNNNHTGSLANVNTINCIDNIWIQTGANYMQGIFLNLVDATAKGVGITDPALDVSSYDNASTSISRLDNAINKVSSYRSNFGAQQNRLEYAKAVDDNTAENTQYAESRIRDTDMAEEMVEYSSHNILAQAGQSMLAQANQGTQGILNLLQ